jgi:hypothetical protein
MTRLRKPSRSIYRKQRLRISKRKSRLSFESLETRNLLASLVVTTNLDVVDGDDGVLSLREAVAFANADPDKSTITFASGPGQAFENGGTIRLTRGEIEVTERLTIDGPDAADQRVVITGDAKNDDTINDEGHTDVAASETANQLSDNSRIFRFTVVGLGWPTLDSITLTGGVADAQGGGAILCNTVLTLTNSTISGNRSVHDGGGFYALAAIVSGSTITNNISGKQGGGFWVDSTATVTDSTITDNTSSSNGGGIATGTWGGNRFTVTNSDVSRNISGGRGGGIYTLATAWVTNSTISNNISSGDGGGLYARQSMVIASNVIGNSSRGRGGGINSWVTMYTSTISNNNSDLDGGGIFADGYPTVYESTISGNSSRASGGGIWANKIELTGSTVSGNSSGTSGGGIETSDSTVINSAINGNSSGSDGGGINATRAIVAGSTISGNISGDRGGGLATSSNAIIIQSTITGNRSASHGSGGGLFTGPGFDNYLSTLFNTIVAGNFLGAGTTSSEIGGEDLNSESATNLIGDAATAGGLIDGTLGNQVGIDWKTVLANDGTNLTLADNGGTTLTIALMPFSSAIDAGSNDKATVDGMLDSDPLISDQRGTGFERIKNDTVDIGAVEAEVPSLVVTTTHDVVNTADGLTSLREAVSVANSDLDPSKVTFASGIGSAFESGGTVRLTRGEIEVTEALTIDGPDAANKRVVITGDANNDDTVSSEGTTDVAASKTANKLSDNSQIFRVNSARTLLTIDSITLTGGVATDTDGGAIFSMGAVIVTGSTISGNSSDRFGGGIRAGVATVTGSTISDNSSSYGGGIYSEVAMVTGSTINSNSSSDQGGGIWAGTTVLTNSTISGNTSSSNGGGLYALNDMSVTYSTISGNRSDSDGDGMGTGGGLFATFNNVARVLFNTIVVGNFAGISTNPNDIRGKNLESASANNLIGDTATAGGLIDGNNGNQIGVDWKTVLANDGTNPTLANNGGPTKTIALLPGSMAINKGDPEAKTGQDGVPEFDQRGYPYARISSNRIDIGAFEAGSGVTVPILSPGRISVARVENEVVIKVEDAEIFRGLATTLGSLKLDLSDISTNVIELDPADVKAISPVTETVTVILGPGDEIDVGTGWTMSGTEVENGRLVRILTSNSTLRLIGPNEWHNLANPLDVNADGITTPLDALIVIDELNRQRFSTQNGHLIDPANLSAFPNRFYDVDSNGIIAPIDALRIINFLNRVSAGEGEGVGAAPRPIGGFIPEGEREARASEHATVVDFLHYQDTLGDSSLSNKSVLSTRAAIHYWGNNEFESLLDLLFAEACKTPSTEIDLDPKVRTVL